MPSTFSLTADQLAVFAETGVVQIEGFYPKSDIALMADRLWAWLETRFGLHRDRPDSWTIAHPTQFQPLKRSGAFAALGSDQLHALADQLLGPGTWVTPPWYGQPLVTFPTPEPALVRPPWHLDVGGERLDPLSVLRVFTFLAPLAPHGGGTLYVTGSHRLALELERRRGTPPRSKEVIASLRTEHLWFADLLGTPTAELRPWIGAATRIGTQELRLEEMTGNPGDLIIMHPAMLHATAHNAADTPRLVLNEWIFRRREEEDRRAG